ncbi:anti-sigma factor family protein [Corynebacterium kroppenstedtii]|uniref:anti-sigma factor family protein n=1 Tax=Corynebacterium sp. PCR 32 TaxID=3351342 RepID=UPI0030A9A9EA
MGRSSKSREFSSIEHLSEEAVAAFVDGEMPPRAQRRVLRHLVHCDECRCDVQAQRDAAQRMQASAQEPIQMPPDLLHKLATIPTNCAEASPETAKKAEPTRQNGTPQDSWSPCDVGSIGAHHRPPARGERGHDGHLTALAAAKSAAFSVVRTVENGTMSAIDTVGEYADHLRCAWKDRSNTGQR